MYYRDENRTGKEPYTIMLVATLSLIANPSAGGWFNDSITTQGKTATVEKNGANL